MPINFGVLKSLGNPSGRRHKMKPGAVYLYLIGRKTNAPDHTDETGWTDKYQKSEIWGRTSDVEISTMAWLII